MSDYEVLHAEPRHHVDDFVDELIERARDVVSKMGPKLEGLLRDMMQQFVAFREAHYLITLDDVHFLEPKWLRDVGDLLIGFGVGAAAPAQEDMPRHVVIDDFVDSVVKRHVPESMRQEFTNFARGMINQFAALKKHWLALELHEISFGTPEWFNDRTMRVPMRYKGKPFTPAEARWN